MNNLTGSSVAFFLQKFLIGKNQSIHKPADLDDCGQGDIVWVKSFSKDRLYLLEANRPSLSICDEETSSRTTVPNIISDNPRLDFIKVVIEFFTPTQKAIIHPSAIIDPGAVIGQNVSIGAYACIGPNVSIGDDSVIGNGVSVEGKVSLGCRCRIKANSSLGGQGFGFEYDDNGIPIHFPHLGRIIIEDDVWLGACTTVEIATLAVTRICEGSKVDDLVQIGHNVTVGRNTLIMANVVICGGATIGKNCWVAPNSVIKEKVRVGNKVTIGLGSVVLRDVEDEVVIAGVPAKPIR
jgi:UDP-3-O-[3-hydroxymyristoyl] glucosamine N-acyltransferase